ncbi:hypothetical protein [Sphingomonas sp.]|uniref:hypothetical protein n=1 Tax=Sphingomonas sp. TaxID=28214 RepID=UPI0035BBA812
MTRSWWQTRGFVALVLLATAIPLLWPTIPPLIDLPGHMARYRVMLGDDPGLARWYAFAWKPIGYLGVDLLVLAVAPVLGLELTVKLVAILIPVVTAAGMFWLSREAHGRVQPLVLFALPLAFHLCFQYGFLNYTLGMALALNAFALWLCLARLGRTRLRAALFLPIGMLLWTVHLFSWIALGAMAGGAEVARARAVGRSWVLAIWSGGLRCLPLAPPGLLLLLWRPGGPGAGSDYLASLPLKPGWLATVLRDRWEPFDIASIAVIGLILYGCARSAQWRWSPPLLGAGLALLLVFVAMPFGAAYADARLAPYAVMLLLLAPAAAAVPVRRLGLLALAGLAFFAARTAATTASFAIEGRDWDRHLVALDHVPHGARVVSFAVAPCADGWRMPRIAHLPGMLVTRRGAFSNDQFDLGSTALLRVVVPDLRGFAVDPSQIVMRDGCPDSHGFRSLSQALARFPRDRLDYLWILNRAPVDPRLLAGLSPVWSDGRDVLYRLHTARPGPRPYTSPLSATPSTR